MNHRPVCVECRVEMRPETNGIGVLDMANFGPYKIWHADKWKCPKCGYEIVMGFGSMAVAEHYEDSFEGLVDAFRQQAKLVECWSK